MLHRELPRGVESGRIIRLAKGCMAPGLDNTPLGPVEPWDERVQPLCWWSDEPVGLRLEDINHNSDLTTRTALSFIEPNGYRI